MADKYIEREEALKGLEDSDIGFCDDEPIQTRNRALKIIQNIPAADVRPVVRGRWKRVFTAEIEETVCSVCRYTGFKHLNFCPNCGADMREVQDGG